MEDFVNVVMMELGLAMGEEVKVVFVRGEKVEAVVGMATGEGFAVAAVLTEAEVSGDEMVGLENRDVYD